MKEKIYKKLERIILADNIATTWKIKCHKFAVEIDSLINQEVERRISERMPSEEEIDDETIAWAAEHQCGTPFSERWIGFVKGAKWLRSRLSQKTDNLKENNNNGSTN